MDGIQFFDNFLEADAKAQRLRSLKERSQKAVNFDIKRCGNCYFWMKSKDCPKERNVNGWNKGPSCNGVACEKFQLEAYVAEVKIEKLEEVIADWNESEFETPEILITELVKMKEFQSA